MSGTVQPPPTATMSVANGGAGVFPVAFGYYPQEGSRAVPCQYNWASQAAYAEDLSSLPARGVETTVQSAYIDNSASAQAVTILVQGTGQVLTIPGGFQGILPLFFTGSPGYQISVPAVAAGAVTRVMLLNVPCSPAVWQA